MWPFLVALIYRYRLSVSIRKGVIPNSALSCIFGSIKFSTLSECYHEFSPLSAFTQKRQARVKYFNTRRTVITREKHTKTVDNQSCKYFSPSFLKKHIVIALLHVNLQCLILPHVPSLVFHTKQGRYLLKRKVLVSRY